MNNKREIKHIQHENHLNSYNCNYCYNKQGLYLMSCSCLFCKTCLKEVIFHKNKEEQNDLIKCTICNKSIDIPKTIDLTKPENQVKYNMLFSDPISIIKKGMECMAFQKNYQKKYNEFLKVKMEILKSDIKNNENILSKNNCIRKVSPKVVGNIENSNKIKNLNIMTSRNNLNIQKINIENQSNKDNSFSKVSTPTIKTEPNKNLDKINEQKFFHKKDNFFKTPYQNKN